MTIIIIALIVYIVLIVGLCRFFKSVHEADEKIERMITGLRGNKLSENKNNSLLTNECCQKKGGTLCKKH